MSTRRCATCRCSPSASIQRRWRTPLRASSRASAGRATRTATESAAARARHGQARRRRAELLVRRRSRVPLSRRGASRGRRPWKPRPTTSGSASCSSSLLDQRTEDGFAYRVDMRLRPFGASGPLAVGLAAFEAYLVEHGRDWERYAYVKARLLTGRAVRARRFRLRPDAVRLPPLPRLRRVRRAAADEAADRARGRAQGHGREHQARPRRHPRDRVHRASVSDRARRPPAGAARALAAERLCRCSPATGSCRRAPSRRSRPRIGICAPSRTASKP